MTLRVNGETRETEAATIGNLLEAYGLPARFVVVEHNGQIVPREQYNAVTLQNGDTLEIVQMMAGG